jgi:hypothetical protein
MEMWVLELASMLAATEAMAESVALAAWALAARESAEMQLLEAYLARP